MKINISDFERGSIVDGPGIRFAIFVQGCPHHCEGCHNPSTHAFVDNKIMDTDEIFDMIKERKLLKGVTFSGGEPFCQVQPLLALARRIRRETNLDIVCYTGYTFEQLLAKGDTDVEELISLCRFIVDGRFVLAQRDLSLLYRGSTNQRLLDGKKSIEERKAVPYVLDELPSFDIEI